jgi:hypothetical protein
MPKREKEPAAKITVGMQKWTAPKVGPTIVHQSSPRIVPSGKLIDPPGNSKRDFRGWSQANPGKALGIKIHGLTPPKGIYWTRQTSALATFRLRGRGVPGRLRTRLTCPVAKVWPSPKGVKPFLVGAFYNVQT